MTDLSLEGAPQANDEWILSKGQDVPLVENLLDLFLHDHAMLADLLHGKAFPGILVSDQVHSTGGGEEGKPRMD